MNSFGLSGGAKRIRWGITLQFAEVGVAQGCTLMPARIENLLERDAVVGHRDVNITPHDWRNGLGVQRSSS